VSATVPVWRRWVLPVALTVAVLVSTWWPAIDRFAGEQVDSALTRALVAFALARGLDGVISVAQSAELAIQPAGIGVSLHPGELLDPINDLVESFSSVMLFAAASLGLQKLLLGISSWWPLKLALSAAMLGLLLARARRLQRSPWPTRVARVATSCCSCASRYRCRRWRARAAIACSWNPNTRARAPRSSRRG
jgi:hypothetical protein